MVARGKNLTQIISDLILIINVAYSQCRKADNCIHWCPDIVRHVGKERTLCPVCSLCRANRLGQCLIHFPVRCTVRHNQNIFLCSVYLAAHCNIMKSASFSGLQMNIFKIPFSLFIHPDFLQIVFLRIYMFL